jgi:hypothetical protein
LLGSRFRGNDECGLDRGSGVDDQVIMDAVEIVVLWVVDVFSEIVAHDKPWWVQMLAGLGCLGAILEIGAVALWVVLRSS